MKLKGSIILCIFLCFGCAMKVPLTRGLIKEYRLSSEDLQKLQYYVSDGILLEQQAIEVAKNIDSTHLLIKKEDKYINQIYVTRKTPCIAISGSSMENLRISFEEGDCLNFKYSPDDLYAYQPDELYTEIKHEPRIAGSGFEKWSLVGTEEYAGDKYNALTNYIMPYLLVRKKSLKSFEINRRKMSGLIFPHYSQP